MQSPIFEQKLSVEGTSLYLLIESLSDSGTPLNREEVSRFWNAGAQDLDRAFTELISRRIAGADDSGAWFLRPASQWSRS